MISFPDSTTANPCAISFIYAKSYGISFFSLISATNWGRLWPLSRGFSLSSRLSGVDALPWQVGRLETRDSAYKAGT